MNNEIDDCFVDDMDADYVPEEPLATVPPICETPIILIDAFARTRAEMPEEDDNVDPNDFDDDWDEDYERDALEDEEDDLQLFRHLDAPIPVHKSHKGRPRKINKLFTGTTVPETEPDAKAS
jgi:hypothetical protein